jgi:hypothetical protein
MRTIGLWAIAAICTLSATLAIRQAASIAATPPSTAPATNASTSTTNPSTASATRPAIPIRYDTTRILGPLKPDGTVDYLAAINEQSSKGVTKGNNAAILLLQALDPVTVLPDETCQEILRKLDVRPQEKGQYFHDFPGTTRPAEDPEWKFYDKATTQPWKAEECPSLAKWLKDNETPLAKAVEASKRQRYYVPLVAAKPGSQVLFLGATLPSLHQYRQAARALAIRANLAIAEGSYEDAWGDVKAGYRLAALIGQGPTIIERLVALTCERTVDDVAANMANSPAIPQQTLKAMITDALELPPTPASAIDTAERYMFLDTCMTMSRDPHSLLGMVDLNPSISLVSGTLLDEHGKAIRLGPALPVSYEVWVGVMAEAMAWGNQRYDKMIEAMNAPIFAGRARLFKAMDQNLSDMGSSLRVRRIELSSRDPVVRARFVKDAICTMLLPDFGRMQVFADTVATKRQLVTIALALAAYNCDHKKYPDKLADLAPDYLKGIPADMFSGQALLYKVQGDGCVVYSVGENMKDDGGKDKEHGGDDIVVTVGRQ